ncbi:MAG: hypothetical protein O3A51_09645 [Verrucomicrobia bacterium]|nr:hypothetical protein [Verrucomicrobiota bacterium]
MNGFPHHCRLLAYALLMAAVFTARVAAEDTVPTSDENGMDETATEMAANAPSVSAAFKQRRDPLWPIGWKPAPVQTVYDASPKSPIRWKEASRKIELSALSKSADGTYFVIVKGIGVVEQGDVIAIALDGLTYRWTVKEINERGLVPVRLNVTNQQGRPLDK